MGGAMGSLDGLRSSKLAFAFLWAFLACGLSSLSPAWPGEPVLSNPQPDFGPNVLILDPSMPATTLQGLLDKIAIPQNAITPRTPVGFGYGAEFSKARYAIFFKPGRYQADVKVGFYTQVLGLGRYPDDVSITGAVRCKADWRTDRPGDALLNFWRGAENLAVTPALAEDSQTEVWAVSQATHLRRVHVKGNMVLSDHGWSSGGFIADSKIDGSIDCGTQQQFLTRNTDLSNWKGGNWNMVFVGDGQAPSGRWPASPFTVIRKTPLIREKPFLFLDSTGHYQVWVPGLKAQSQGPGWTRGKDLGRAVPIESFYLGHPQTDTAQTLNAALSRGKHLILTPGLYHLSESLHISHTGTILLGLGIATLIPDKETPALTVEDVDGVTLAGLLLEAGPRGSPTLLRVGGAGSRADHSRNPTALFDVHATVGGSDPGKAENCFTVNSNNVIIDNCWLWRCDDGAGVGWNLNKCDTGLIVNGNHVTAYGLFVEHYQGYQTIWNGNGGRVYFYQSEMPYDPPAPKDWGHDGVEGYASYKVADSVTSHDARGLGIYCVFDHPVWSENAAEAPLKSGVSLRHIVTLRFGGSKGSGIRHVLNGSGKAVDEKNKSTRTPE